MTALSANKKRHLIFVYVTQGYSAAKPLAIEYGVSPKTLSKYTRAAGIKGKRGPEFKSPPKPKAKLQNHDRWQRAIQRGGISL